LIYRVTPLTRRQFLWTTAASSLAWPLLGQQQARDSRWRLAISACVASGDPLADRLILWTRITPPESFIHPTR